eukprot:Skav200301  [mRNA]  locus=scaffold4329:73824:74885:- [translate_table: standard]
MAATGVAPEVLPDCPGAVPQPSPRSVHGDQALEAAPEFDQIRTTSEVLEEKNQQIFSFNFKAPVSLIPSESTFQKYLNKSDAESAKESLNKAQWSLIRAIKQHELAQSNYESLVGEDSVRTKELAEIVTLERSLKEAKEERAQLQKKCETFYWFTPEAEPGWTEEKDCKGTPFYRNRVTGQAARQKPIPVAVLKPAQKPLLNTASPGCSLGDKLVQEDEKLQKELEDNYRRIQQLKAFGNSELRKGVSHFSMATRIKNGLWKTPDGVSTGDKKAPEQVPLWDHVFSTFDGKADPAVDLSGSIVEVLWELKVQKQRVEFQLDRARLRTEAIEDKTAEIEVLEAELQEKKLPWID